MFFLRMSTKYLIHFWGLLISYLNDFLGASTVHIRRLNAQICHNFKMARKLLDLGEWVKSSQICAMQSNAPVLFCVYSCINSHCKVKVCSAITVARAMQLTGGKYSFQLIPLQVYFKNGFPVNFLSMHYLKIFLTWNILWQP